MSELTNLLLYTSVSLGTVGGCECVCVCVCVRVCVWGPVDMDSGPICHVSVTRMVVLWVV